MNLSRRLFAGQLLAAGSQALYGRFVEPLWFDLTFTRVRIPGAPARRILHISDLHVSDGTPVPELTRAVVLGLATKPDIICLTGDFVTTVLGFDAEGLYRMLRLCAETAPCLAVMGNHDGYRGGTQLIRDMVAGSGIEVLHNASTSVRGLRFTGVADLWSPEFRPEQAFADGPFTDILLCHNPDAKGRLRDYPWNLMLSGHTHGGQIRLDPVPVLWAPVRDRRFLAGLYQWEDRQLFITRGAGSPKHVRLGCRPEISVLEIGS